MYLDVDLPSAHDDGRFISNKVSRVVELIREYDHRLDVKWIPADLRSPHDPAFAIVERLSDGREVVAFYVEREEDFNENILARIYEGDTERTDVQSRIESQNRAAKALMHRKHQEELEQHTDLIRSMVASKKHTYKHDNRKFSL